MLCKKPYLRSASQPYGCGQCLPCRYNKRRLWTNRLLLEGLSHSDSAFVTLTYDDEHLPKGGTLVKAHYQKWLKSLRKFTELRYYVVGEYGDQTFRPHYHAAIYGIPAYSELFQKCWPHGNVHVGDLTPDSAQYIVGYVVKKMTKKDDPRLGSRIPEFGQPSLKPGIGALAVPGIADVLTSEHGVNSIVANGDVPLALRYGNKNLPLGRYLRRKIREQLGHDPATPQETLLQVQSEMCSLLASELQKPENKSKSIKAILVDLNRQKVINLESRMKIFSKKGPL